MCRIAVDGAATRCGGPLRRCGRDAAHFYGAGVANELIHAALHPYPADLVPVSKVGAERDDRGGWLPAQRPEQLRAGPWLPSRLSGPANHS